MLVDSGKRLCPPRSRVGNVDEINGCCLSEILDDRRKEERRLQMSDRRTAPGPAPARTHSRWQTRRAAFSIPPARPCPIPLRSLPVNPPKLQLRSL